MNTIKRLLIACSLAAALFAQGLNAQELTAQELARANDYLKKTSGDLLASVQGLSEAQLNFKPAPVRWSVAETAEHIAAAEDFLRDMIQNKVLPAPGHAEPVNVKETDDFVVAAIPDRTRKAQAPEPLVPTKRFGSMEKTLKHFKEARAKTLALLNETKDLRAHVTDSPLGKKLDAYQWILFIAAHSERHTKQIEEVKADPGFPKK